MNKRDVRVSAEGVAGQPQFASCQRCGLLRHLRTLDVAVPAIRAGKGRPASPAGWCPLIALCGDCWSDVARMLREARRTKDGQ